MKLPTHNFGSAGDFSFFGDIEVKNVGDHLGNLILTGVLPQVISILIEEADCPEIEPARIYNQALSIVIECLTNESSPFSDSQNLGKSRFLSLTPLNSLRSQRDASHEQIGLAYEYLRGFKLTLSGPGKPNLAPSRSGKRNQGLFYTPKTIVSHIVGKTLDTLEIADPCDYLDLRIVDPAVGTGVFLVEAMRQCVERILCPGWNRRTALREKIGLIMQTIKRRSCDATKDTVPDAAFAVRIHLAENCLYGVDLDPIAIKIARFALLKEIFGDRPPLPCIQLQFRLGNSLIGSVRHEEPDPVNENLFPGNEPIEFINKKTNSKESVRSDDIESTTFNWSEEFREVFQENAGGFHAVIGNPPYEIVSVKESGIRERSIQQAYYRQAFRTCKGKINLYRLMLERGLDLLRKDGVLGFIVPATLLSDSTALNLRKMILDASEVIDAVVIPEKAKIFQHVTQALLIIVCRKGRKSSAIAPVIWNGNGPIPRTGGVGIPTSLVQKSGWRIPIISSHEEKTLMESLLNYPPLRGNEHVASAGRVHQGEINLTLHREFLTATPTGYPLIRGEHVAPFRVIHPSSRNNRLDWMLPRFLAQVQSRALPVKKHSEKTRSGSRNRGVPWQDKRIALARVVNMATVRRLKAALVQPGCFLGDMTNFIADVSVPIDYLVGLLNSSLLNWRIKLTSTNNYLSAAEVEGLPLPRIDYLSISANDPKFGLREFERILETPRDSVAAYMKTLNDVLGDASEPGGSAMAAKMVERVSEMLSQSAYGSISGKNDFQALVRLLDALTLKVYSVESFEAVKIFSE